MQANESPKYRQFIEDRDRALEELHTKAQLEISDVLRGAFQKALHTVSHNYSAFAANGFQSYQKQGLILQINNVLRSQFLTTSFEIFGLAIKLRTNAFTLSFAGEVEAIARTLDQGLVAYLSGQDFTKKIEQPAPSGGHLLDRIQLYLDRIERRILDAVQLSSVLEEWPQEALERAHSALPKTKKILRPKRILKKPILEAVRNKEADDDTAIKLGVRKSSFLIDETEWQSILDDYKKEFVPKWRGPDEVIGKFKDEEGLTKEWYAWELEQELTQDFVQQVRDGQVQAAKDNGIKDFVWIAVIDDKTDECCSWRDGLTTSEIEHQLRTTRKDDECRASVPPAHFNCRCTLAPILDGAPESPPSNIGDFEEWLNQ